MLGKVQDIDLKLLRVFQTVAKLGGFSAAQSELNTSQSTISTSMSQLEQRLGMRLCERGIKGFRLTHEGEQVLGSIEHLFAAMEDFRTHVSEVAGNVTGELRIGLVDNIISHPDLNISKALQTISREYQDVEVAIHVGAPNDLEGRILDGRIHVAIGPFNRELDLVDYEACFQETHLLYCGREHPFFDQPNGPISIDEVAAVKYVSRDQLENVDSLSPPITMNAASSSRFMEGLAIFILSGEYIAYLPTHYAQPWVDAKEMQAIEVPGLSKTTPIYRAKKKRAQDPLILETFLKIFHGHSRRKVAN